MKKEKLIEELQKLPNGIEICVFDWRKNFNAAGGDPSGAGVYLDFEMEVHILEADEAEIYKDIYDKEFVSFATLNIENDDYPK